MRPEDVGYDQARPLSLVNVQDALMTLMEMMMPMVWRERSMNTYFIELGWG